MNRSSNNQSSPSFIGIFIFGLLGLVFFVLAVSGVASRTILNANVPGEPDLAAKLGFKEYQDGIYFPLRALITGTDPYDAVSYSEFHPNDQLPRLVSPTTLILHAPLGFLSIFESQVVYLLLNFLMAMATAAIVFRSAKVPFSVTLVLIVAGLMLICRPGLEATLGLGLSISMMFGVVLALEYSKSKWWVGGLGVLITTCNLAFAFPLMVLMFFRRDFAALFFGGVLTFAVWAGASAWLSRGDHLKFHDFFATRGMDLISASFDPNEMEDIEREAWNRIDAQPLVARIAAGEFFPVESDVETDPGPAPVEEKTDEVDQVTQVRLVTQEASSGSEDLQDWQDAGTESLAAPTFYEQIGVNNSTMIVCLLFGAVCLIFERAVSQNRGVASRSGLLIVLLVLVSFPHSFLDGVLLWAPLAALLVAGEKFEKGVPGFLRMLLVVCLLIPVFNFLSPGFVSEQIGIKAESLGWPIMASLNSILLVLAALLAGLVMIFSRSDSNQAIT